MTNNLKTTLGFKIVTQWLNGKGFKPFDFQLQAWQSILENKSGLINAPTGCGKTYSVFLGSVIKYINQNPTNYKSSKNNGLQLLWVTPLRALATDIAKAMQETIEELELNWKIGIRNGDTTTTERQKQKRNVPEILIITPESLHLLLAQKNTLETFKTLTIIAVDEWHELLGSKRGVQVELAISKLLKLSLTNKKSSLIWGISATIGNLNEAKDVLLFPLNKYHLKQNSIIIKAQIEKKIKAISIIPDEIEKYPWAGHLGLKLATQIIPIINQSTTTLVFINTRGMSERWYQTLLDIEPNLAGSIALHHGSIEKETRAWIENALHEQKLKVVVCTASLDLGVDFRPVDTVIQVGSPKGVSRFLQRAGRSGHAPGETSKIYFLPTNSLELLECVSLQKSILLNDIESKQPMFLCFDVLLQYLCTLAVGDGFYADEVFEEIQSTFCFSEISTQEWQEVLLHITQGGKTLEQYEEYKKVEVENGLYKIKNRRIALRHRVHIGTIVSDAMMKVKLLNGKYLGVIEEWFISKLETGDSFILAGRNLEMIGIKDMNVQVKPSNSKKTIIPSWMGGRMSLSSNLGKILRETIHDIHEAFSQNNFSHEITKFEEITAIKPLMLLQKELSHIPQNNELLIEQFEAKDGFHFVVYPFEGRQVHEALSAIIAMRLALIEKNSFSIAMNDYGFELHSEKKIEISTTQLKDIFSLNNLYEDIQASVNSVEMAKRKFRDIAVIGGLIFQGMPGESKKARHLQSSASLIFKVFSEYDVDNILLKQAYQEVIDQQMDEVRLRGCLERIARSKIVLKMPKQFTPFSFPIIVDGLNRNNLSNEKLEDRIKNLQDKLNKAKLK